MNIQLVKYLLFPKHAKLYFIVRDIMKDGQNELLFQDIQDNCIFTVPHKIYQYSLNNIVLSINRPIVSFGGSCQVMALKSQFCNSKPTIS